MDVILLERIEKLGSIGDVVKVKNGYARNFLLPNGKALIHQRRSEIPEAFEGCFKSFVPYESLILGAIDGWVKGERDVFKRKIKPLGMLKAVATLLVNLLPFLAVLS